MGYLIRSGEAKEIHYKYKFKTTLKCGHGKFREGKGHTYGYFNDSIELTRMPNLYRTMP